MSFYFVMKGITVNVAWLIWHKLRPNIQLNSSKLSRTPLASPLNKISFWSKPWMRKICMTGCTQSTHFWREKSGIYVWISFTEILRFAIKTHFQYFYSIAKVLHFLFYLFFRSSTARNRPKKISNDATPHASQGSITTPTNPMPTVTMTPPKNWASFSSR